MNPELETRGLAVLFNPLSAPLRRSIRLPLYYTGLESTARVRVGTGPERPYRLARDHTIRLELELAPGMTWVEIR